jgi:hypothetical protein
MFKGNKPLRNCVKTLGLAKIQPHVFICTDQIVPKSNTKQANLESWEHLLVRLQRLKLDQRQTNIPLAFLEPKPTACEFVVLDR